MKAALLLLTLLTTVTLANTRTAIVEHYGTLIHATYANALAEAKTMDKMITRFVDNPTEDELSKLKQQWIKSRFPYSQSEVCRFYDGPIDDDNGFEGWINAWPIDEAYLDYVEGKPDAGLINHPDKVRGIDEETLFELNEQGGEADICTGYHAIEFLLWGQDFYPESAGKRPLSDFITHPFAKRRRDALQACSRLLVTHLSTLEADWAPRQTNYRRAFEQAPANQSLTHILTGMAMLAGFELASERLAVAYDTQSQEDEHSCFSDTTHLDLKYNILGIQNVWLGRYGTLNGPGVAALIANSHPLLQKEITTALQTCLKNAEAIPAPFDQAILGNDDTPNRQKILACIESLEELNRKLLKLAEVAGLDVQMK